VVVDPPKQAKDQPAELSKSEVDKILTQIYYGESSGAWRGPEALWKEVKRQAEDKPGLRGISLSQCRIFLSSQPAYTLYRPARRNYPRNHITAFAAGEIVQVSSPYLLDIIIDLMLYTPTVEDRYNGHATIS
jgi:hypothetical protein